jgi:hypothetical protein
VHVIVQWKGHKKGAHSSNRIRSAIRTCNELKTLRILHVKDLVHVSAPQMRGNQCSGNVGSEKKLAGATIVIVRSWNRAKDVRHNIRKLKWRLLIGSGIGGNL